MSFQESLMSHQHDTVRAIEWRDDRLFLLDQRLLPQRQEFIACSDAPSVAEAIRDMVVRGAPAIGISAAYAVVMSAMQHAGEAEWGSAVRADVDSLAASRPTAVNLFWALDRMRQCLEGQDDAPVELLLAEACRIHEEDAQANHHMGELGAALIDSGDVITHCNAGALATGGYGTALGVIRSAFAAGKIGRVYADETRPWLQGARLTAWELVQDRIPVTLLCEGAAASLMKSGRISWVIVGSDRIAANGDVANKIGTYSLAVNARYHGVRFMVVAPTSTIDMQSASAADIPIEERDSMEVLGLAGKRIAAEGAEAWNPAFDVTPAELVDAIVTEKGVVLKPDSKKMKALMAED
jgi:methylthioribose-1-phosphate isomerase